MKKILLIEDNKDVRENTAEILSLAQFEVLTAKNGKEGVEMAFAHKPDVIICDIMMPVLDGYGVLHLLSKNESTSGTPFIFLTAKADKSDFRKGMELGADDYITKPFDDVELLNAIDRRLKKNEILQKEFSRNHSGIENFINDIKTIDPNNFTTDREIIRFKRKDTIYQYAMYPKGIYLINKGKVKDFQTNDQGKELITALYSEGEYFGYLSLLQDEKYTSSATALEDTELYMIPKEEFLHLIYNDAAVSRKFIKIISDNLKEKEKQLLELAYNSVRKRVAEALIKLSDKYKKESDMQFTMTISREDLANMVGTATETVIRVLGDFKEDKMINVSGGTLTVLEYNKLLYLKN